MKLKVLFVVFVSLNFSICYAQSKFKFSISQGVIKPITIFNRGVISSANGSREIISNLGFESNVNIVLNINKINEVGLKFNFQHFIQYINEYSLYSDDVIVGKKSIHYTPLHKNSLGMGLLYKMKLNSKMKIYSDLTAMYPIGEYKGHLFSAGHNKILSYFDYNQKIRSQIETGLEYFFLQNKIFLLSVKPSIAFQLNQSTPTKYFDNKIRTICTIFSLGITFK